MGWPAMVVLGAYHGINPGMGWLFAVALGMQAGSVRGVWRALPPIALGHALSIGGVLLVARLIGLVMPVAALKLLVAAALVTLGLYRLWRHRHPRFGGMQVSFADLTMWSFLMASAHGAGFMLLPFVLPAGDALAAADQTHAGHVTPASASPPLGPLTDGLAAGIHTLAYLMVMTLVAWLVYRKLGLGLLRRAWLNMDWVWAAALATTGIAVWLM